MADQIGKALPEIAKENGGPQQGTAIELWGKVCPQLEEALGFYDKLDLDSLPEKAWLRGSKASYQQQIDKLIDAMIRVLGLSGAAECRNEIKKLQQAVAESLQHVATLREQRVSAPPEASVNWPKSIWANTVESSNESIADEESEIEAVRRQIGLLKERFRNQLQQIGVEVYDDEIDFLLMPVTQDDFVSMAAVVRNITALTAQLERLTDESKELPSPTRRYYGMHLLLVYAVDRIQTRFIQEIDHVHLTKLSGFEAQARQIIAEARNNMASGGPKEQYRANIAAAEITIEACHCFAGALRDQKTAIVRENEQIRLMLDAAINTYKTVGLCLNVADFMRERAEAFHALRELRLPKLRPFQNVQLKAEMQRLAERLREGGHH